MYKYYFYKFVDKLITNLPVVNFAVSTTSLYLQCNYLFLENKKPVKKLVDED
jgi:hypothetical protein